MRLLRKVLRRFSVTSALLDAVRNGLSVLPRPGVPEGTTCPVSRLRPTRWRFHRVLQALGECMRHGPDWNEGGYVQTRRLRRAIAALGRASHIHIMCMPKSGSTFLTALLRNLTGYCYYPTRFTANGSEQYGDLPAFLLMRNTNTVSKNHSRAVGWNVAVQELFGDPFIVQTRNIFDIAISYYDHLHKDHVQVQLRSFTKMEAMSFLAPVSEVFYDLPKEQKLDLIIDYAVPWYLNFFISWTYYCSGERPERPKYLWLRYDDLVGDPVGTLRLIVDLYGLSKDDEAIERAVRQTYERGTTAWLNKGVAGRRKRTLSQEQCERIFRMAEYHRDVDFSSIGIPRNASTIGADASPPPPPVVG